MKLCEFIEALATTGAVTLAGAITGFEEEDIQQSLTLLQERHAKDALNMPGTAPDFDADAALWAAVFLYRAMQFALLRHEQAATVAATLTPYPQPLTAASMYSADLSLRHLPSMLHVAKYFAPGDVLVACIQTVAKQFPLSAVGIALTGKEVIPEHPSLRAAYIDRVIQQRDTQRYRQNEVVKTLVTEALGNHTAQLWPGLITA